ncbi:MAG: hypothetical protein R3C28_26260 [Pirellulaceae bacterium]
MQRFAIATANVLEFANVFVPVLVNKFGLTIAMVVVANLSLFVLLVWSTYFSGWLERIYLTS